VRAPFFVNEKQKTGASTEGRPYSNWKSVESRPIAIESQSGPTRLPFQKLLRIVSDVH